MSPSDKKTVSQAGGFLEASLGDRATSLLKQKNKKTVCSVFIKGKGRTYWVMRLTLPLFLYFKYYG